MENEKEIFMKVHNYIMKQVEKEHDKFVVGNKHNFFAWSDFECLYTELFKDYFRIYDEERAERLKQMEENHDIH